MGNLLTFILGTVIMTLAIGVSFLYMASKKYFEKIAELVAVDHYKEISQSKEQK